MIGRARTRFLMVGLLLVLCLALVACRPTAPAATVLTNGTLIDGTGAPPMPDAVVVIREGRIEAVGPRAETEVPAGARVIDVQGGTILPGFFNAHVHGGYSASNLRAWGQAGVTTVRDLGSDSSYADLFRTRAQLLERPGVARLISVGVFLTAPGGYPIAQWGNRYPLTITSPEDAREKTAAIIDAGADVVKIGLESGAIFGTSMPMLSREEAAAIVQAAHERGVPVSAHVSVSRDLALALDAGVDDIAHMVTDNLPDELIARMVSQGTYWEPTIELWKGVGYGLGDRVVPNLARYVAAGGQVALGTDYLGAPGVSFDLGMPIHEIEWMQEAGMTPMQVIVAGTRNGAHVCNRESDLGTLEAGKIADILVVDGDPLVDIHALLNVRWVLRDGAVIRE